MKRTRRFVITLCVLGLLAFSAMSAAMAGTDPASPDEVVKKVKEGVDYIEKNGDAGFASFNDARGPWVWKDTYAFVFECDKGMVVAHPVKPKLVGKDLMGMKDVNGNYIFVGLCEASKKGANGGWTEYWWPKPGEKTPSRKITYMRQVPGTPYQIGAGIYNDKISVEQLDKMVQ